jgi:hypothetical protein
MTSLFMRFIANVVFLQVVTLLDIFHRPRCLSSNPSSLLVNLDLCLYCIITIQSYNKTGYNYSSILFLLLTNAAHPFCKSDKSCDIWIKLQEDLIVLIFNLFKKEHLICYFIPTNVLAFIWLKNVSNHWCILCKNSLTLYLTW